MLFTYCWLNTHCRSRIEKMRQHCCDTDGMYVSTLLWHWWYVCVNIVVTLMVSIHVSTLLWHWWYVCVNIVVTLMVCMCQHCCDTDGMYVSTLLWHWWYAYVNIVVTLMVCICQHSCELWYWWYVCVCQHCCDTDDATCVSTLLWHWWCYVCVNTVVTLMLCMCQHCCDIDGMHTVFDVITELFACVITGQKKCRNYRTPPPLDLKWRTSVTQLIIIENTKTHNCWQTRYEIAFPAYYLINH